MSVSQSILESYLAQRPESIRYYDRACRAMAGGVGHDLRHLEPVPLYIKHGKAGRKWDVDNNEYVDFLLGNGALLMGHAPPDIVEAIAEALRSGTHFGNDHPLHIEWAERVQQLIPSAERVRFVNSGTEATQLALRIARAFSGRSRILRFEGHFHGWHDGVIHGFQPPFDADGSRGVPLSVREQMVMIPDNDLNLLDDTLAGDPDIAAAILEPSGASWGRVPLTAGFLEGLREITSRRDVLLIFDEVVTGFRFSPGGAQGLYGVTPDISCLAKVLAGGMPGGAVVGRQDIMALFDMTGDSHHDRHERVTHQGTFNGAPLSAAAGIALLKQVATGEPIERANAMSRLLHDCWEEVLDRHAIAGYVYGPCSTFHVYFETDHERVKGVSRREDLETTDPLLLKGMPPELITSYQQHLRYHGVDLMSSTGGVLSAAHTREDILQATEAFEETILVLLDEERILRI